MKKITRKKLKPFLLKHTSEELVLDIGGGRVTTNHSYEDIFPNRHTFDIDPERLPDTVGDVHSLPFADNSHGFILCTEVLEHLHSPQKAIDEMKRVLTPGGKILLTTRFVFPIHDAPIDYFRFSKYGLQLLFKDWEIIEIVPETETFSAIAALLQRIGFQTDLKGGKITKLFIYSLAKLLENCDWLIKGEYANIKKDKIESEIMTTGYYVFARKK